jgi:hypothetical protein
MIEITRSDGAVTMATTRVPGTPMLSVRRPTRTFLGRLEQELTFHGVSRQPELIVVNYGVTFGSLQEPLEVRLPYNVVGVPVGTGWRIVVRLTRDKSTVLDRLALTGNDVISLHTLSVDVRLLSADWPLDEAELINTNVTNGFGFFGSAVTHRASWVLDSVSVGLLGYVDKQNDGTDGE